RAGRTAGAIAVAIASTAENPLLPVVLARSPGVPAGAPTPSPTPAGTPLPAWAAQLADKQLAACGSGPTAAQLAAMGKDPATEEVNQAIADCQGGGGGDHGKGKGKQ